MTPDLFALERLRQDPDLSYEALREVADREGVPLLPIHYGRARRQLGPAKQGPATNDSASSAAPERPAHAGDDDAPTVASAATAEGAAATAPLPASDRRLSKPSTPAFEFLMEQLRAQPTLSYGELRAAADQRELKIAPIMYGRAKALLGLVPVRPRGQGKRRKRAANVPLERVRAETPEKFAQQLEAVQGVEDLRAIARQLDMERRRLRASLEQIATEVEDAIR